MDFYFVRHGDAFSAAENPQRPLSPEGRRRVERSARLALDRGIQTSIICHSGILRAAETAEILARHFPSIVRVEQRSGLLPDDDPAIVKAELDVSITPILLVGHLPFMSRLAGLLVNGDPERPVVDFSPAAMVCCARSAAQWKLAWHLAP